MAEQRIDKNQKGGDQVHHALGGDSSVGGEFQPSLSSLDGEL